VTDPVFLADDLPDPLPAVGSAVRLGGTEGRHAAVVRRIGVGETVVLSDGRGRGVRGPVTEVSKAGLTVTVAAHLQAPVQPVHFVAVQALAKGDRDELAIEMLTELGVDEVVPWQAQRSIVRWSGERSAKGLAKWRSTVREAAKQSRRLTVPAVSEAVSLAALATRVAAADLALVLHEEATEPIAAQPLPQQGEVLLVIGPEGGMSADEVTALTGAGGRLVSLGDSVLRTSTAGVVALAALRLR
jgi:16S rRNA (uracil1498-N3)-methyltransferase